jgi:hypothetical protein
LLVFSVVATPRWKLLLLLSLSVATRVSHRLTIRQPVKIPVEVDFGRPFAGSSIDAWESEYLASVRTPPPDPPTNPRAVHASANDDLFIADWWRDAWGEYADFDHHQTETEYDHIGDI